MQFPIKALLSKCSEKLPKFLEENDNIKQTALRSNTTAAIDTGWNVPGTLIEK